MFALAILFGIYSYSIFALGLMGILYKPVVVVFTVVFIIFSIKYIKPDINDLRIKLKDKIIKLDRFSKIITSFLIVQIIVNLIGVLGPEISFDALWYHLTLPKIFLEQNKIFHIAGGLLYYSDMPKLGETLYIGALSFGSEILAKFIHYVFGILCLFSIYNVANKFVDKKFALIACLIFYSNLVVGWESTAAYIDLIRTFFEITAFWAFLDWVEKKDNKLLYESAIILGLAISTKLIAVGSLIVFAALIIYQLKDNKNLMIKSLLNYSLISFFVTSPWFVYSYLNTGNLFYPLFTQYYVAQVSINLLNPFNFLNSVFNIFFKSPDPISPIYVITLPLIVIFYKKLNSKAIYLLIYCAVSFVVWYITPQTGGGRFFLPYLPVLSILTALFIVKKKELTNFFTVVVIIVSILSIGYRFIANSKFIPVVLGIESKEKFMSNNLNFSYGDFYDIDGFFKNNIKQSDRILLYGFHNLYYVDFPFIDSSYVKKGDTFNYIAVQNSVLPQRFSSWDLIYSNSTTHVNVYTQGGLMWHY